MPQTENPAPNVFAGARAIALVGFMGAGKTSVGRELALILGWRFDDMDALIEAREAQTIEQIFQDRGEAAFRELERIVLRETLLNPASPSVVLALGGGAFVDRENQKTLSKSGVPAVFLDAAAEELYQRCADADVVRPLRRDFQQFSELYELRRPHYLNAQIQVQTSGRDLASIAREIISKLKLKPLKGVAE